jgi:hypothetical protein
MSNSVDSTKTKMALREWDAALKNARSFNTLLLQLRSFGIPIVVTIMGGGLAFSNQVPVPNLHVWMASVMFILMTVLLFIAFCLFHVAAKADTDKAGVTLVEELPDTFSADVTIVEKLQDTLNADVTLVEKLQDTFNAEVTNVKRVRDAGLAPVEKVQGFILIASMILILGVTAACYPHDFFGNTFSVGSPVVIGIVLFALSLLLGLYGMDRFYYDKLLMGAVNRARHLEKQLGFTLTHTIRKTIPPQHARTLITTMYWLPALSAIVAIMVLGYWKLWTQSK